MASVVTRFAPSPTSLPDEHGKYHGLHLGGARTALFSYVMAKKSDGKFILRVEDTDKERSSRGSEEAILESLRWIGITSDATIIRQSERNKVYQEYLDQLLENGHAYKCYCTPEELEAKREAQIAAKEKPRYDRTCFGAEDHPGKPFVVRLKVPDHGRVTWHDGVLGRIQVNNLELSDPILQRSDGSFCFLFVNMLDDALQGVTHVLRGQDGVSHCHSQILLCEALGFEPPQYAHVPFVLGDDGQKLSKRNGAKSVLDLRDEGFLPEAVVNALARIGWSYKDREILSIEDIIDLFDVKNLNKAPGAFDPKKLLHLNAHYIKEGKSDRLATLLAEFLVKKDINLEEFFDGPKIVDVVKTLQNRAKTLVEMADMSMFYWKSDFPLEKFSADEVVALKSVKTELASCEFKDHDDIGAAIATACLQLGKKLRQVGPAIRMALTGSDAAPGIYEMLMVLGKDETLKRLKRAISL